MTSEQTKINGAAEELVDAVRESYRVVASRGVSAQEHNAGVAKGLLNGTISNMRAHAEQTRKMARQLAEQRERQLEAAQALTQESVGVYRDFVDSMFSYWREGIEAVKEGTKRRR